MQFRINIHNSLTVLIIGIVVFGMPGFNALADKKETSPTSPVYTLDECIQIGLERSATLSNARRDTTIAEAIVKQTRAQVLPQLQARADYTRRDELSKSIDQTTGDITESGELDNYSASIEASQLLFSGGSVKAALRAAKLYREQKNIALGRTKAALIRDIRNAFYDILLARANVEVNKESVAQLKQLASDTKAKYDNGLASEFDYLSAKVRLANEEPLLIDAQRKLNIAKLYFRNLIFLDDEQYDIDGTLSFNPVTLPLEDLQLFGQENRPEIMEQKKLIGLYEMDIRAEQGTYFPDIRAHGAYAGSDPRVYDTTDDGWEWHWNAGVSLEWDLYDGGLRAGNMLEKHMTLAKAVEDLRVVKRNVDQDVQQYYLDVTHAAEAYEAGKDNVTLAEKGLEIAKSRYDEGLSTYLEYTDSNLALSKARLIRYRAIHMHLVALAQLQYACGLNDDEFNGVIQHGQ